jgi:hypothetical protein
MYYILQFTNIARWIYLTKYAKQLITRQGKNCIQYIYNICTYIQYRATHVGEIYT